MQEAGSDHRAGHRIRGILALEPHEVVRQIPGADAVEGANPPLQTAMVAVGVVEVCGSSHGSCRARGVMSKNAYPSFIGSSEHRHVRGPDGLRQVGNWAAGVPPADDRNRTQAPPASAAGGARMTAPSVHNAPRYLPRFSTSRHGGSDPCHKGGIYVSSH